jgi:hypothetical protein
MSQRTSIKSHIENVVPTYLLRSLEHVEQSL